MRLENKGPSRSFAWQLGFFLFFSFDGRRSQPFILPVCGRERFQSVLNFPRDSSTQRLPQRVNRSWMYGSDFVVTRKKKKKKGRGRDEAKMMCIQWLLLERLALTLAAVLPELDPVPLLYL